MTARQKKIFKKELDSKTPEELAEAWKVNRHKKLTPEEIEQYNMICEKYKQLTGKTLPPFGKSN